MSTGVVALMKVFGGVGFAPWPKTGSVNSIGKLAPWIPIRVHRILPNFFLFPNFLKIQYLVGIYGIWSVYIVFCAGWYGNFLFIFLSLIVALTKLSF